MTKTIICGWCNNCITVTKFVYTQHQKGHVKVKCPRCKKSVVKKSELPPTRDQLTYIQGLGGSITGISTRDHAKRKINELLLLKKRIEDARKPRF